MRFEKISARRSIAVVVLAATLAVVSTADAGAASGPVSGGPAGAGVCATQAAAARSAPTVVNLRAFGDCEIARRQATLAQLANVVKVAKGLTASDAAALRTSVSAAQSEMAGLKTQLDSETAAVALKVTITQIVSKARVYLLVVPQVRLTIAADDVLSLQPHLTALSTSLEGRIADARAAGRNVTRAQAALDAMNAALAKAVSLASTWPARLVSLTPADSAAGTAGPTLNQARLALGQASAQLKLAVADGRAVLAALA
jgi:hypothetical protein